MNRSAFRLVSVAITALISLSGCALAMSPVTGFLYSDVKHPGFSVPGVGGPDHGEACASSILGIVANGDASIETAKKNGGIVQVTSVDYKTSNILLVYSKYCTIVYGKKG